MHTPAPPLTQNASVCPDAFPPLQHRRSGFSLIEVTLAIAIVAFAFVSLIGLLPAGMSVFNQTMDATNEMRISGVMTSMIQATDYDNLVKEFNENLYYFDADGGALDTKKREVSAYEDQRIYTAKVVLDVQVVQPNNLRFKELTEGRRALILVGKYNETVNGKLAALTNLTDVTNLLKDSSRVHKIKVFPMIVTKTDGLN